MSACPSWPVSHRSFVNTWECDENNHWNVQFYFRAFQQASEIFAMQHGRPNPASASATCRHIRYHRELHASQSVLVRSGLIVDGGQAGRIAHRLEDSQTGILSATALDLPAYDTSGLPEARHDEIAVALPKGVTPGPHRPHDTAALLKNGKALESNYSVAMEAETDGGGEMTTHAICSRLTDSAPHVWHHVGVTGEWLKQNNCGRVAVEFAMTRLAAIPAGTGLVLVSWVPEVAVKTMLIRHQFEDIATRQPLAVAEVRALVMDLGTRRAVPVPEIARRHAVHGEPAGR